MKSKPVGLPTVDDNDFREQEGVIRVASVTNRARLVWRPTTQRDVGIDGQIEHVNSDGRATGTFLFVQIKSGATYFRVERDGFVHYNPSPKHAGYWERAMAPVILILHDEDAGRTIWVDARDELRKSKSTILVPSGQHFDVAGLRAAMGPVPDAPLDVRDIALEMIDRSQSGFGVDVDFMDLFVYGLVDAFDSLYFGMDLVDNVVEAKLALSNGETWGYGEPEYRFIHDFVRYLLTQDLARVDYDAFHRAWENQKLVGRFLAPLSARGEALARYLADIEHDRGDGVRAVQSKLFGGITNLEYWRRSTLVEALKETVRAAQPSI